MGEATLTVAESKPFPFSRGVTRFMFSILPRFPSATPLRPMQPCRDCCRPTPPSARSCPACGILNPVVQWVALPGGSHLTHREPVGAAAAPVPRPIAAPAAALSAVMADEGAAGADIRKCANAFYGLGAFNALVGAVLYSAGGSALIFEGILMAGLAFVLRQYRSRVAGVLLIAYAAFTTLLKVSALLDGGGRIWWILLWGSVTGLAFKATVAAFQLQRERALVPA